MRKLVLFGIASVVALAATASARQIVPAIGPIHGGGGVVDGNIIYDNSDDVLPFLIGGNDEENGDGVTLAGTDRVVTNISLWVHALGGAGTADAQVRFFVGGDTGPFPGGPEPGAMLWESAVFQQMAFAGGLGLYDFAVPNIVVPDEMTWTLALSNVSAGNTIGSRFIGVPTVGSSGDWVWNHDGGVWTQERFAVGGNSSYGAIINAVPEPATLVLLGLGGLALIRRRR